MVNRLLKIHNQGYSRELNLTSDKNLILDDGWHNLRNDISGSIGFEFKINKNQTVTHLGMWDDHDREIPVRMLGEFQLNFHPINQAGRGTNLDQLVEITKLDCGK